MAITIGRFIRFIRSIFVPATAIIGFSCLLTFFFVLYQPTRGPGEVQRLGWQSWDVVSPSPASTPVPSPIPGDPNTDVDWWNVTDPDASPVDSSSLPLDVWSPLLPQDTGRMFYCFFVFLLRIALRVAVDSVRNSRRALYVRHDYDGHMRAIIFHFRRCNQGKVGARATRFESPEWDVAAGE